MPARTLASTFENAFYLLCKTPSTNSFKNKIHFASESFFFFLPQIWWNEKVHFDESEAYPIKILLKGSTPALFSFIFVFS